MMPMRRRNNATHLGAIGAIPVAFLVWGHRLVVGRTTAMPLTRTATSARLHARHSADPRKGGSDWGYCGSRSLAH